jgi:hypothetical protein
MRPRIIRRLLARVVPSSNVSCLVGPLVDLPSGLDSLVDVDFSVVSTHRSGRKGKAASLDQELAALL